MADEFGPQWLRLSDQVRRMLSHAEAEFEMIGNDLGRYKREYKGTVINYAICFEIELGRRLKGLFLEAEVQSLLQQRNSRNPRDRTVQTSLTLGSYLTLLILSSVQVETNNPWPCGQAAQP